MLCKWESCLREIIWAASVWCREHTADSTHFIHLLLVCSAFWEPSWPAVPVSLLRNPWGATSLLTKSPVFPIPWCTKMLPWLTMTLSLWPFCLPAQPHSCLLPAFQCHFPLSSTGLSTGFESLHNLDPSPPRDPSIGIVLTDRALNYLRVSSATRQFMWGGFGSRLFISLLDLAESRFIDLQVMPQNLAVFLGFSQGGYGSRPRHYGILCWSTFSDTELLKSLYFIMMCCCVWSFRSTPTTSIARVFTQTKNNQSIYCSLWTVVKFHCVLVAHLFTFSFQCFTGTWKKLRLI